MSSKKISPTVPSTESIVLKWLPLIAAGGALGVSFYMLREIQRMKKETVKSSPGMTKEQIKQIEAMDDQLRKVSGFLAQQFPAPEITKSPKTKVVQDTPEDEVDVEEVEVETEEEEEVEVEEEESAGEDD